MTKEELEQLKSTVKQWLFHTGSLDPTNYANELKSKFIEPREKRITELEKELEFEKSVNGEFTAIEKLRELEKENAELKSDNDARKFAMAMSEKVEKQLREENTKLTDELKALRQSMKDYGAGCYENGLRNGKRASEKDIERQGKLLEKAMELLEELYDCIPASSADYYKKTLQKVADFLKDSEVEK